MRWLTGILCFLSNACLSQGTGDADTYLQRKIPSFIPVSPNASSISRLADINSNQYSGLVDLSIPIYTIAIKNINIPVALGYNSSGVKVDELSSSCGMNWALNAGGVVTRTVRGKPDDSPIGYMSQISFGNLGIMKVGQLVDLYVRELLSKTDKERFERQAAAGSIDTEPDIYNYSFPGYSGRFFIAPSGRVITIPYEPLQISGNFSHGMTIIDTYGNRYEFYEPEMTVNYTRVRNEETRNTSDYFDPEQTVTALYLTRIVSSHNEDVKFRYASSTIKPTYNAFQARYFLAENTYPTACLEVSPFTREFSIITTVNQQVRQKKLHEILFPNGSIQFNYLEPREDLPGDSSLSNIIIKKSNGSVLKQHTLKHTYYSGRLFLSEVHEGNDGFTIPPYKIEYYNPMLLPPRNDYSQDHWGYYNGMKNNSLIPAELNKFSSQLLTLPAVLGNANREPDADKMRYGVISKVVYPTGGYSTFEFEPNSYSKIGSLDLSETKFTLDDQQVSTSANTEGLPTTSEPFSIDFKQTVSIKFNVLGSQTYIRIVKLVNGGEQTMYAKVGNTNNAQIGTDYLTLDSGLYRLKAFNYEEEFIAQITVGYQKRTNQQTVEEKIGGGIRIYKITHYDNISNHLVKQKYIYRWYNRDVKSSGILLNSPKYDYFQKLFKSISCRGSEGYASGGYSVEQGANYYVKLSNPTLALNTTKGSFVGYKTVSVLDDETGENGYTIKQYRAPDEFNDQEFTGYPFTQGISNDFARGQMSDERIFNSNNDNLVENSSEFTQEKYILSNNNDWMAAGTNIGYVEDHPLYPSENKWKGHKYFLHSEYLRPSVMTSLSRDGGGDSMIVQKRLFYDNVRHLMPTREEVYTSRGEKVTTYKLYPLDYGPGISYLNRMIQMNILAKHIEEVTTIEDAGKIRVRSGSLIQYKYDMPIVPDSIFSLQTAYPVHLNNFKFSNSAIGLLPTYGNSNDAFEKDGRYKHVISFPKVDSHGNILSQLKASDVITSFIWGYNLSFPTAEVINAENDEIFFDSFEEAGWGSNLTAYDNVKIHSGDYSGRIDNFTMTEVNAKYAKSIDIALSMPKKFRYSGWVFSSSPAAAIQILMKRRGATESYSYTDAVSTNEAGKWVFLEKEISIPADVTSLDICITNRGGGTVWFDDIRLHPSAAQMTTYTYNPLVGMTSRSDINDNITYYEYDKLGRLNIVRDQDKNILKSIGYHYAHE